MINNKITLFIIEGEKTEVEILESLSKNFPKFFEEQTRIFPYKTAIYRLYEELYLDEGDFLEPFAILKGKDSRGILKDIGKDDIAYIYLLFDYDGHSMSANDEKLKKMIEYFSDETDKGKLYVSYPMIEATKHLKNDCWDNDYNNRVAKSEKKYKVLCEEESFYKDIIIEKHTSIYKYNIENWRQITKQNLQKANFLLNGVDAVPKFKNLDELSQINIFNIQMNNFIRRKNVVSVLSSIPFFLSEYFKEEVYNENFK